MEFQGSSDIIVRAEPERIWAVLVDSTLLPQWAPMVKHTTGVTEKVGSVRTCQVEWDGRKDQVVERCVEAVPNRKIAWVMEQGMMTRMFSKISFWYELDPKVENSTLLRLGFLYEPRHLLARLMYPLMMKRRLKQLRQTLLENVKRLAEARTVKSAPGQEPTESHSGLTEKQDSHDSVGHQIPGSLDGFLTEVSMGKRIALAAFGYTTVTFIVGVTWHLLLFKDVYEAFGVYSRKEPIIPMGLASMIIQGIVLAILYSRQVKQAADRPFSRAIAFNILAGLFFVSGTVLALAAKAEIAHLGAWFQYNLAFSLIQFLLSGVVFGFVFRGVKV